MKTAIMVVKTDRISRPLDRKGEGAYRISLGFQVSHPRNRPLFGVARVDCYGACNCTCSNQGNPATGCRIDTLQNTSMVTVTTYLQLLTSTYLKLRKLPQPTSSS